MFALIIQGIYLSLIGTLKSCTLYIHSLANGRQTVFVDNGFSVPTRKKTKICNEYGWKQI